MALSPFTNDSKCWTNLDIQLVVASYVTMQGAQKNHADLKILRWSWINIYFIYHSREEDHDNKTVNDGKPLDVCMGHRFWKCIFLQIIELWWLYKIQCINNGIMNQYWDVSAFNYLVPISGVASADQKVWDKKYFRQSLRAFLRSGAKNISISGVLE